MERLTRYFSDWAHGAEGVSDKGLTGAYCRGKFEATAIVDRLAAIEDILGDTYDLDHLRELVEADREGRCVVLPCKIEDDVYINLLGKTLPFSVISIFQMASTPTFKAMHGVRLCYIFKADDVGKTVFRTREAAEQALREE